MKTENNLPTMEVNSNCMVSPSFKGIDTPKGARLHLSKFDSIDESINSLYGSVIETIEGYYFLDVIQVTSSKIIMQDRKHKNEYSFDRNKILNLYKVDKREY